MSDERWKFEAPPAGPPSRSGQASPPLQTWSPPTRHLTPTAPPSQGRPGSPSHHGPSGFLPSVAPPGEAGPEEVIEVKGDTTTSWGWRALVAFLAGGLLAVGGFAAAQFGDETAVVETAPVNTVASRSESVAPPIVVEPPDIDTTEPVSFVAQILGPSVVQVEIPNLGLGSGVVFDDGLILTNHHVIEGSTDVDIRTADGRVLEGTVVGSDARTDIAVVDVGPGSGLPVAQLAVGEELEVGQLTIAIGSPFQLQQTVTSGVISALNRPLYNGVGLNAMIQTDAAINPGNSGGALADRNGRVIGINTAIQTDGIGNSNIGVGFAVPIDTAINIADRVLAGESMEPGFLGVAGEQSADGAPGVVVTEITEGSAAADAGVRIDDRILSIDGAPVTSLEELAGLVQTRFPGDQVELELVRGGETVSIIATLGER